MRIYISPIIFLLFPVAAMAESVAVMPVSYKIFRTGLQSDERASLVEKAVGETIMEMGLTPITGTSVSSAGRAFSPDGSQFCTDKACLSAVASRTGADFSASVSVVDNDGQFDIQVHVSGEEESATARPYGTFNSAVKRITAMVKDSLMQVMERRPQPSPSPSPSPPPPPETETEKQTTQSAKDANPVIQNPPAPKPDSGPGPKKKPLPKAAFFATLGVTLGLGAAYASVEGVGYSKWQDLKDKADRSPDDEDSVKKMQLASRILLGFTAAGVITTTVFVFLTDFDSLKDSPVALAPSPMSDGGGLILRGDF